MNPLRIRYDYKNNRAWGDGILCACWYALHGSSFRGAVWQALLESELEHEKNDRRTK